MLQLNNATPFAAMPMLFADAQGIDTMFAGDCLGVLRRSQTKNLHAGSGEEFSTKYAWLYRLSYDRRTLAPLSFV